MLFDNLICDVKILTVLKLSWDSSDADANPRKFHALSFRTKGNACYIIGENKVFAHDGDILFVPKDLGYHIKAEAEELYVIHFEMTEKKKNYLELFHIDDYTRAQKLFAKCYDVWNKKEPGYYLKTLSIFYNILELMTISTQPTQTVEVYEKLKPAMDYLHEHFTSPELSVLSLCNLAHLSDTWFRKLFLEYYGTNPVKYINNLRIGHAKKLIESGYYEIEQIAEISGFNDSKYFSTVFKQLVGCSPSNYKKQQDPE